MPAKRRIVGILNQFEDFYIFLLILLIFLSKECLSNKQPWSLTIQSLSKQEQKLFIITLKSKG